jgi:type VI protein secretion system component Hcp
MPLIAYLDCPPIKGTSKQGFIPVIACNHHSSPKEPQVFVVRKKLDAVTQKLHEEMDADATFSTLKIMFWHNPRSGPEFNYLTVTLKDAKIAWISIVMPDAQLPEFANVHEYEDVAFSFASADYSSKPDPA